jgi:hypothetical protein
MSSTWTPKAAIREYLAITNETPKTFGCTTNRRQNPVECYEICQRALIGTLDEL